MIYTVLAGVTLPASVPGDLFDIGAVVSGEPDLASGLLRFKLFFEAAMALSWLRKHVNESAHLDDSTPELFVVRATYEYGGKLSFTKLIDFQFFTTRTFSDSTLKEAIESLVKQGALILTDPAKPIDEQEWRLSPNA